MKKFKILLLVFVLLLCTLALFACDSGNENNTETPTQSTAEAPTEAPTQSTVENPTETPTQSTVEIPTGSPTQSIVENPTEAPTQSTVENPTEAPTQENVEQPTDEVETPEYTEGLQFELISDGGGYEVYGIGDATDTHINIPPTYEGLPVVGIADYAFQKCETILNIYIPDSVTYIGAYAFEKSSVDYVHLGTGITRIGEDAFEGTNALEEERNIYYVGDWAVGFSDNDAKTIQIRKGTIGIGDQAFYVGFGDSTKVIIPDTVKYIGQRAFEAQELETITIPQSVITIGEEAFCQCNSLTDITFLGGATSIGNNAFYWCRNLSNISFGNGVVSIGKKSFYNCSSLTDITFPDSLTSIGEYAFSSCTNLQKVTIGNGVKQIEKDAFSGCRQLSNVTLGNNVEHIGESAFYNCIFESITLPVSVTQIDHLGLSSYYLTDIYYAGTSSQFNKVIKNGTWGGYNKPTVHYMNNNISSNSATTSKQQLEEYMKSEGVLQEGTYVKTTTFSSGNVQYTVGISMYSNGNISFNIGGANPTDFSTMYVYMNYSHGASQQKINGTCIGNAGTVEGSGYIYTSSFTKTTFSLGEFTCNNSLVSSDTEKLFATATATMLMKINEMLQQYDNDFTVKTLGFISFN